ncbi:hypothetical protein AHAS_Ahas09G0108800 [Arachis hypogaea]
MQSAQGSKLHVGNQAQRLRSLRDLTQHLTARPDDSHALPVSAFPNAPISFKRIRGMSIPGKYPSFTARTTGVSNPIHSPSFRLSMSVSAQQSTFAVGLLSDLYAFHRSTGNFLCPTVLQLGSFHRLSRPPTDALCLIILDNACILCLTATVGTELADAYSLDTVIASSPEKEVHDPVPDHPLGPATDHQLSKLLPHQLANQTRAPPRADSSFCSLAYGKLVAISNCCFPSKGRFLRVTHPSITGNATSHPTCMCKACRQRSF